MKITPAIPSMKFTPAHQSIYVATRASDKATKIGRTFDIRTRLQQLTYEYGAHFFIYYTSPPMSDATDVELFLREALEDFLLPPHRELFSCSAEHATQVLHGLIKRGQWDIAKM